LALRQIEGSIGSIMGLLEIDLPIPDHDAEPAGVWIADLQISADWCEQASPDR
jgi:hypothetical protein